MVSLVRDGVISPLELVDAHLSQIAHRNPELNAFVEVFDEQARHEASTLVRDGRRGLLHGIPVTVKDSFDVAGYPTRCGSPDRPVTPAAQDAPAVARLRAAGAVILGRTNTSELLQDYECGNPITGRTNNPWDLTRTPGGSSGGEAAAIAACCSPGGIGSDGGGSIRIPAHFCGIAGLKPTPGRIPATGHFPELGYPTGLVTTVGPLARTVQDLRLLFSALAAFEPDDPFSVPVPLRELVAGRSAHRRVGAVLPGARAGTGGRRALPRHRHAHRPGLRPRTVRSRRTGARAERVGLPVRPVGLPLPANSRATASSPPWPNATACARPSCARWARPAGHRDAGLRHPRVSPWRDASGTRGGREIGMFQAAMPAVIANVLGLPAVTLPITLSPERVPVGMQLIGRPFEDELLLEIALRLEEARGPWIGL